MKSIEHLLMTVVLCGWVGLTTYLYMLAYASVPPPASQPDVRMHIDYRKQVEDVRLPDGSTRHTEVEQSVPHTKQFM